MKLTSPYNFVPLNESVYVPSWWNKVSMDVPFSDGEDGTIEVTVKTISPMFIRNGHAQEEECLYSANVSEDSDPQKQYIIPGTSLKGMIANVLEILSFGKMQRYNKDSFGSRHSISDGIKQEKTEGMDLCDTIFGYSSRDTSLRGRVQVGTAWADRLVRDDELTLVEGVLGQPKASYYPFYLSQKTAPYNTYDTDGLRIAGRKRYRIHKGSSVMPLPPGNGNEAVLARFYALPGGLTFTFKIRAHNLRPQETGALLSALTFHGTNRCWHNIGLAKSLGYGKVLCEISKLSGFTKSTADYLRCFETEMSIFIYSKMGICWHRTTEARTLAAIAAEHNDEGIRFMTLKEYGQGKMDKNFGQLTEVLQSRINSYLDENELINTAEAEIRQRKLNDLSLEKDRARQIKEEGKLNEAIKAFEAVRTEMARYGFDSSEVTAELDSLYDLVAEQLHAMQSKQMADEAAKGAAKRQAGLAFLAELDGKQMHKVKDWKGAKSRIEQWMKKEYPEAKKGDKLKLPDGQWDYLHDWLSAMFPLQKKGDQKKWANPSDGMWTQIAVWTSEEKASEWFNEIKAKNGSTK